MEQSLAKACALSHSDPTVAKVLPYLLILKKDELQFDRLEEVLTELKEKHTGGFFLALACELSGDERLGVWAEELRDKRRTKVQDFFVDASSKRLRALAERNTPEVARRWRFRINLGLDEFRSVLEKFPDGRHVPG